MLVALHDSDDTNFPNLALMKLAAWHKRQGHNVVWYAPDEAASYDLVFSSKVFSWTPESSGLPPWTFKSGTGYGAFHTLPDAVEHICPDYSIYRHVHERRNSRRKRPEPAYSLGFTTRGCVNSCSWCVVPQKEGQIRAHADVEEFCRHRHVVLLDNNALAHDHGIVQIEKMTRLGLRVDFNQGLDARRIDGPIARRLAALGWFKPLRLACDQKGQMPIVERAVRLLRAAGARPKEYFCYVLVTDVDEAYERVMFLRGLGLAPFAQAYRDFTAEASPTKKQRLFCRWVNHKALFKSILWPAYWEQEKTRRGLAAYGRASVSFIHGRFAMAGEVLWRDTGIAPKIFILDARAVFPLALWLFHWAYWTAAVAAGGMLILYLVQRTGMSPLACFRALRVAYLGRRRETRSNEMQWRKRCRW